MAQLGELKKNADKFNEFGVEVIAVFREDKKGVEGLELIKKNSGVDFTLCLDTGATKTSQYSPEKRTFDNYVVNKSGLITKIIEGDLRNRAKSNQLLEELAKLSSSTSTTDSATSSDKTSTDSKDDKIHKNDDK